MKDSELNDILVGLTLARATDLARQGRYYDSCFLLTDIVKGPAPRVPALDLLARVRTQQGRLAEAKELWEMALALEPNNHQVRAALTRLDRAKDYSIWRRPSSLPVTLVLIALTVALVYLLVFAPQRQTHPAAGILSDSLPQAPQESQAQRPSQQFQVQMAGVISEALPVGTAIKFRLGHFQLALAFARGREHNW
jgi:hypothetical protein